jgi:hypothetical protein
MVIRLVLNDLQCKIKVVRKWRDEPFRRCMVVTTSTTNDASKFQQESRGRGE